MNSHHKTALGAAGQSRPPAAERQPLRGRRKRGFLVGLCAHAALALRGCWSCQALLADDWLAPSPVSPWTSAVRNSRGRVRAMPAARTVPREPHRPRRLCGATRLIVVAPARRRSGQGAGSRTAAPFARRRTTSSDTGTAQYGRQRLAAAGGARGRQERHRRPRRAGQRLRGQEAHRTAPERRLNGSGGQEAAHRRNAAGSPGGQQSGFGARGGPGRRQGGAWTAQEARRPPFRPSAARSRPGRAWKALGARRTPRRAPVARAGPGGPEARHRAGAAGWPLDRPVTGTLTSSA